MCCCFLMYEKVVFVNKFCTIIMVIWMYEKVVFVNNQILHLGVHDDDSDDVDSNLKERDLVRLVISSLVMVVVVMIVCVRERERERERKREGGDLCRHNDLPASTVYTAMSHSSI